MAATRVTSRVEPDRPADYSPRHDDQTWAEKLEAEATYNLLHRLQDAGEDNAERGTRNAERIDP